MLYYLGLCKYTFARRRNCLKTHFSERIPVVKRRISVSAVYEHQHCSERIWAMQYLRSFLVLLDYRRIAAQYVLIVRDMLLVSFRICKSRGFRAFCQESVVVGSGEMFLLGRFQGCRITKMFVVVLFRAFSLK